MKYIPLQANGSQSILYDIWAMLHAIIYCDILLVLGVSGCLFLPFLKLFSRKKIIVNIDGLEWRRAKWSPFAKSFLRFSEKVAVRFADEIVTDNAALQDYVAEYYGIKSKLIAYGGDHTKAVALTENVAEKYPFLKKDYAFKVCRIEPENNIHLVLEAFVLNQKLPLVIVGNWAYSDYGKDLLKKYQEHSNIHLLPPIYDSTLLNMMRSNAKVYVHGHSAGGTNPSLVEAMYLALPIVAFDVSYNLVTTDKKAFYFSSAKELSLILENLTENTLEKLAKDLKQVANQKYTWKLIAQKYAAVALENPQNISAYAEV
jgi:glycosyltransferase involved in cell wall biosynthesis